MDARELVTASHASDHVGYQVLFGQFGDQLEHGRLFLRLEVVSCFQYLADVQVLGMGAQNIQYGGLGNVLHREVLEQLVRIEFFRFG